MIERSISPVRDSQSPSDWSGLAQRILDGQPLTQQEGVAILESSDDEILDVLAGAFQLRRHYFGVDVQLYFLMNAKSGLCPEDCSYCSQSKNSDAEIPKYNLLNRQKLLDGARLAFEKQAKTYCIVISARGPNESEMKAVETIVPEIKQKYDLKICACLGLLTAEQSQRLKACGVDRVNHNLNTGRDYYSNICSTHTYDDRVDTLEAVRDAGLEICSGGIVGMGEKPEHTVQMALELRELGVQSIPVNFLIEIEGATIETTNEMTPRDCLRTLAMFRFANPDREIRIAGGRELHLRSLQPLGLYAANSIFVGDYLTTDGQAPEEDYQMLKDLGFTVTRNSEVLANPSS